MSIDDTLTERGDRGDTIEGFTDKPITFSQVSILRDPAQNHAKKARLHFGTSPVQGDDKDIKKALSRENQYCLVFEESNNGAIQQLIYLLRNMDLIVILVEIVEEVMLDLI